MSGKYTECTTPPITKFFVFFRQCATFREFEIVFNSNGKELDRKYCFVSKHFYFVRVGKVKMIGACGRWPYQWNAVQLFITDEAPNIIWTSVISTSCSKPKTRNNDLMSLTDALRCSHTRYPIESLVWCNREKSFSPSKCHILIWFGGNTMSWCAVSVHTMNTFYNFPVDDLGPLADGQSSWAWQQ